MERYLGRFSAVAFALLRIVAGMMFAMHGAQKLLGMFGGNVKYPIGSMVWFAGAIELVAGLLIMVGLFAGFAAFLASGTMAVAYFIGHFPHGFWPIVNQGELAVLYCFVFLYIASHGSGIWSVDQLLRGGRPRG